MQHFCVCTLSYLVLHEPSAGSCPSPWLRPARPNRLSHQALPWFVGQHGAPSAGQCRLGLLLLQHRTAQEAITYLNRAVAALPTAFQPWVCLVIAHQRCGDLVSAREVLAQMHAQGFDAAQLAVYEQELNEPTPEAVQALTQLIHSGNRISAEIAARMMVADYPSSDTARDYLVRVKEMEAVDAA